MVKYSAIYFLLFLIQVIHAQNTVCFDIEANPNAGLTAFSNFTKYVRVLDCFSVYAESSIPDAKVLHAAAVAAELLDNDEDGEVDDPVLKAELGANGALIPIFAYDGSSAMENFFDHYDGEGAAAVLWRNEIDPNNPGYWGADATVEEVVHVINAIGHTNIYPGAFAVEPNSSLLTTAIGLIVAIPAVAAFNWLERRIERLHQDMQDAVTRAFTVEAFGPQETVSSEPAGVAAHAH